MDRHAGDVESFAECVTFLRRHTSIHVISNGSGACAAVAPLLQGRVMVSALHQEAQPEGWINRRLIASGKDDPHINAYGGEDRFWLGPEGGQFSIFFPPGSPFDFDSWQTPAPIDRDPFEVLELGPGHLRMRREARFTNWSGTEFEVLIEREVRIDSEPLNGTGVSFSSVNSVTNIGSTTWRPETGLLSIWILGMFRHSPDRTVVIPVAPGTAEVNDRYFGKVGTDRLRIRDGVVFFKGDGQARSKIGVAPGSSLGRLGSVDVASGRISIVAHDLGPPDGRYVNSMWEMQADPYDGDVVNSYNDGPPSPGVSPLGPFYELETSSPAAELDPGQSLTHRHVTTHLWLDPIAMAGVLQSRLGTDLRSVRDAWA